MSAVAPGTILYDPRVFDESGEFDPDEMTFFELCLRDIDPHKASRVLRGHTSSGANPKSIPLPAVAALLDGILWAGRAADAEFMAQRLPAAEDATSIPTIPALPAQAQLCKLLDELREYIGRMIAIGRRRQVASQYVQMRAAYMTDFGIIIAGPPPHAT